MQRVLSILLLTCFVSCFPFTIIYASSVRFGIEIEPPDDEPSPAVRAPSNGSGGGGGSVGTPSLQNQPLHPEEAITENRLPATNESPGLEYEQENIDSFEPGKTLEPKDESFTVISPSNQPSTRTNVDRSVQGEPTANAFDTILMPNTGASGNTTQEVQAEQNQTALTEKEPTPASIFSKIIVKPLVAVKKVFETVISVILSLQAKTKEVFEFVSWLFS